MLTEGFSSRGHELLAHLLVGACRGRRSYRTTPTGPVQLPTLCLSPHFCLSGDKGVFEMRPHRQSQLSAIEVGHPQCSPHRTPTNRQIETVRIAVQIRPAPRLRLLEVDDHRLTQSRRGRPHQPEQLELVASPPAANAGALWAVHPGSLARAATGGKAPKQGPPWTWRPDSCWRRAHPPTSDDGPR